MYVYQLQFVKYFLFTFYSFLMIKRIILKYKIYKLFKKKKKKKAL